MSFAVLWDWPALTSLHAVHWRTASAIDAAVIRFAAGRAATIEAAPLYHLRAAGHSVVLTVDRAERTVTVLHVYPAR
jgi:hypothetical protein